MTVSREVHYRGQQEAARSSEQKVQDKLQLGQLWDDTVDLLNEYGTRSKPRNILESAVRYIGAGTVGLMEAIQYQVTPLEAIDHRYITQYVEGSDGKPQRVVIRSYNAVPSRSDLIWITKLDGRNTHMQLKGNNFAGMETITDYVGEIHAWSATSKDVKEYQKILGQVRAKLEQPQKPSQKV